MSNEAFKEIKFVAKSLKDAGFHVTLRPFGSQVKGNMRRQSDVDVALVATLPEKERVFAHMIGLARSPERSMNWGIDLFDHAGKSFGYNHREAGTLHLIVLSSQEYESDLPLAISIRNAATNWIEQSP